MWRICVLGALMVYTGVGRASVVLNEILYDPPGPDGGSEFVELFHEGPATLELTGCRLVFVNGSDPSRPSVIWEASPEDRIEPRSYFVVGGENVQPRQATASFSLQNGPDALQLWRDDMLLDAVAWGALEGVGEGDPAPDVSGTSLGRTPDGADTDDNAADWFELEEPNPGAPNLRPVWFQLEVVRVDPPWRLRAGPLTLTVDAVARGGDPRQETTLRWRIDDEALGEIRLSVARGDTMRLVEELQLSPGRHLLRGQAGVTADTLRVPLQVGLADVLLSEILARPESGPEWIELRSLAPAPVTLKDWALADAGRRPHALPDDARLAPGAFAVVAQDCAALSLSAEAPCWELQGGWPALNNTASDGPWADEVFLIDAGGAVVDWAPYDDRLQPGDGVSMERSLAGGRESAVWFASPGDPTPGRANLTSGAPVPDAGLEVSPNPFSPDGDGLDDVLHVVLRRDAENAVATADIVDLAGEPVRELGEREGGGLLQWIWDGRDRRGQPVAMGAYVVVVQSGVGGGVWRALVALGRRS